MPFGEYPSCQGHCHCHCRGQNWDDWVNPPKRIGNYHVHDYQADATVPTCRACGALMPPASQPVTINGTAGDDIIYNVSMRG